MTSADKPTNTPARQTHRAADRFASELALEIDGAPGRTRNVSATGVYFETTVNKAPGSRVHFVVMVMVKGQLLHMVCAGEVVRVEHKADKVGIAVKLSSSFFTDTNNTPGPAERADD